MSTAVTYRFEYDLFYQSDELKKVSDTMNSFGFEGLIGLGGEFGKYDVTLSSKTGDDVEVTVEQLEQMRDVLQDEFDKLTADPKYDGYSITVKHPFLYKIHD